MEDRIARKQQLALDLCNRGEDRAAVRLLKEIVNEQPEFESGQPYYDMALCYERLGILDEAETCYKSALSYQPQYDIFVEGYACFLFEQERYAEALTYYLLLESFQREVGDEGLSRTARTLQVIREKLSEIEEERR